MEFLSLPKSSSPSPSACRCADRGSYISRGVNAEGLGLAAVEPLPPCLASSPRPGVSGNGPSSPEIGFELCRQIGHLLDDEVDHAIGALDLAAAAEQGGAKDRTPVLLEIPTARRSDWRWRFRLRG